MEGGGGGGGGGELNAAYQAAMATRGRTCIIVCKTAAASMQCRQLENINFYQVVYTREFAP